MTQRILVALALGLALTAGTAAAQDTTPPCENTNVSPATTGETTACIYWYNISTGDDCYTGLPTMWEVRKSTTPLNSSNWQNATLVCRYPCLGMPDDQGVNVDGLTCNTHWYFALFWFDEAGNRSPGTYRDGTTQSCGSHRDVVCESSAPCDDIIAPSASPYLNSTGGCENIDVSWAATGDDINIDNATSYDLRWSNSPITTDAAFNAASPVPGTPPTPGSPGTQETFSVYVGNCGPHKYFALKIVDEAGNKSGLTSDPYGAQPACVSPPEICTEGRSPTIELTHGLPRAESKPLPFLTGADVGSRSVDVNFELARAEAGATLDLSVYNVAGQRMTTLRNSNPGDGRHTVRWDLRDDAGRAVKSGIYFVRLRVASKFTTQRVVVVR